MIAQTDIEIKSFINKNKLAIKEIHKTILIRKTTEHNLQFKSIVKKQLLTIANYNTDSKEAFKQAIELRLICIEFLNKDLKLRIEEFNLNQSETDYKTSLLNYNNSLQIKLPKETIIFVNAINSTDKDALNKFTLNIK